MKRVFGCIWVHVWCDTVLVHKYYSKTAFAYCVERVLAMPNIECKLRLCYLPAVIMSMFFSIYVRFSLPNLYEKGGTAMQSYTIMFYCNV